MFEPNIQSAFMAARRSNTTARARLETARRNMAAYAIKESAYAAARAELESLWQSCGHTEGTPGLGAAREKLRAATAEAARVRALVSYHGPSKYAGTWQPESGMYYAHRADSMFRDVRTADSICRDLPQGYFDNPFGESTRDGAGLVLGYVAQLPGRDGKARYVAGYQFGSTDDRGVTFDLARIFEAPGDDHDAAQRDAARAADGMAEKAAESEREYQTAWQAGRVWADSQTEIDAARETIAESRRAIMAAATERKQAAARAENYPALCDAIRGHILGLYRGIIAARAEIEETRQAQERLAAGDSDEFYFYPGEERLRAAFCEGAELDGFPA